MTNYSAKTVRQYISKAPKTARANLRAIRAAVRSAVPRAEEGISWGKPFYKYQGVLAGFDALKNHITFEIWADALNSNDKNALEKRGYKVGRRSFQIGFDQKVPTAMIKKIVKARAKENEAKGRKT